MFETRQRLLFPLVLAMAACSGDGGGKASATSGGGDGPMGSTSTGTSGAPCSPEIESIRTAVFETTCAGSTCHGGADPAAGLDLVSTGVDARLVEQPSATCDHLLVVPGASDESFLVQKIDGRAPDCGQAMPPGGALSADAVACIRTWIDGLGPSCETCGGGSCVDLASDPAHCGACGTVCPTGATCDGACTCPEGQEACGDACVDVQSHPDNCGSCGRSCPPSQVCDGGDCSSSCSGDLLACDGACVDVQTSAANCGACGVDCGAGGTCVGGQCSCAGGGDVDTDPQNCGACGNVCAPGQDCVAGACTCASGSVSFAAEVQPIFTQSCATTGCHKGAQAKEGLKLTAGDSYAALVDVPAEQCGDGRLRVEPSSPENSYLMDKILGVDLCFGTRMPKVSPLPGSDAEVIANWICAGAPDN